MAITAEMVKELRDKTGAGMMDCKKALTDADGETFCMHTDGARVGWTADKFAGEPWPVAAA